MSLKDSVVVLCAANSFDGIKLADQHFAEQLSRLVPVLYVDPPLSPLTPLRHPELRRSIRQGLRMQAPGLARLTPVVQPWPSRRGMADLTTALSRGYLRRAASRLGGNISAVISAWPNYPVFGGCGEQVSIYWAQDDFVGGAELLGFDARRLDARERQVAATSDVVVAANPVVLDTWRARGRESVLIPFGVDAEVYRSVDRAELPTDVHLKGPIVGFVGQINDRMDLRLLESVADRGRSVLLVGPVSPAFASRFDAFRQRHNVCWVGPKPFEALPGYFRLIDVGIVPYGDSAFNRGSFPLKTLEYLAAGRAVVATALPAIRWLATDLVAVASEPKPFADQVDHAIDQTRSPALVARRQGFAAQHSWASRAIQMHELVLSRTRTGSLAV
jgi:teichuronic acid biosynthesis glycosyltransferase TuaH